MNFRDRKQSDFHNPRAGATNFLLIVAIALLVLAALAWGLSRLGTPSSGNSPHDKPLFVYCAAGIRPAAEIIAAAFEKETGTQVQLQYGGSNTLLSQIEAAQTGDLFLAADFRYIDIGREKNICVEAIPLAWQQPVLLVQKGNPKNISSIDDLLRDDIITALCNPEQAAVGSKTRKLLQKSGHWKKIEAAVRDRGVFKPTVPEICNDVKIGSAHVAVVWDAIAKNFTGVEAVAIPELTAGKSQIVISVLNTATNSKQALQLARYFGAQDRGMKTFAEKGFEPVDGDDWAIVPEITFFCGAVNRLAIEPVIQEFQQREGVEIKTVFNGCGILTGQMKSMLDETGMPGFPDTYMACDVYYLDVVKDLFQDDVRVSDTEVVICTQKGNPKKIKSLADLVRPGITLAVGQPDQCTIGVLTRKLFQQAGLYEALKKNFPVEKPTSAMLIPAVTTESVDATLAYLTDARSSAGKLEIIPVDSESATAIQPFSIARSSNHKHTSRRLYDHIARSREHFEAAGFHWRLQPDQDAAQ